MRLSQKTRMLCAAIPLAAIGCSTSDKDLGPVPELAAAAVIPCIGSPSEVATTYSEKRVFLESQGWWGARRPDGTVPTRGDAEHIHVGMCFPLQQTISGTIPLRVRVMAHNLPVGSVVLNTSLHDPGGGSIPDITWNHKITQAEHDTGWMKWDSVSVDPAFMKNGLREFRNLTAVRRPDSTEIHASSGWCWTITNGTGTPAASGNCVDTPRWTSARGWYDCFEYKLAETRDWDYPYAGISRTTSYSLTIGARDGASQVNNLFTSWEVRWDPDFHAHKDGMLLASGTGPAYGKLVTLPATPPTGVHKLVIIGSANGKCTVTGPTGGKVPQDGEVSAVFAVPIKVN